MNTEKTFAGIGSRKTPPDILKQMEDIAAIAGEVGYILNSGGADGADTAFEGVYDTMGWRTNIFLPHERFNGRISRFTEPTPEAYELAATVHPAWDMLNNKNVKPLIARNMHQILGWSLTEPVDFVCCWTEDGAETTKQYTQKTGGTGSAISLAYRHYIPVFNLRNPGRYEALVDFLRKHGSD